jgi:hypothetical protein
MRVKITIPIRLIVRAILLIVIALLVLKCRRAHAAEPQCYTKTVVVCPTHKPVHKKVVVKPGPLIIYQERIVYKATPYYINKPVFVPTLYCPGCGPTPHWVVGGWAAIGLGVRDPYVTGNVGLLVHQTQAHLGLRVYSVLQYGVAAQLLPYVYQGDRVNLHIIDPGVLITGSPFAQLGDADIGRRVDILIGAGVEVKLTCHLALTADLRTAIPDPAVLARSCNDCGAKTRVDAGAAVGNAFASTQLLLGLLLHN